jgi:putative heme-binding domain-containing protein
LESELAYAPYRGHLLSALFNLHKVVRHELVRDGATFSTRDTDLVASDSLDFHPTDVLEDADGSILILDTGGWYKLCCPTSQLSKPDVLGSIYRLRRTSARRVDDPRGKRLDWQTPVKQLAKFARDPRHMVRSRLWEKLSESSEGIELLSHLLHDESDARLRAEMLWALGRAGNPPWNGSGAPQKVEATLPDVKPHVRRLLGDPDETVRQSAAHLSGLVKDRDALPGLVSLLNSPSAGNRRAAAEALGRLGDSAAIPSLLAALQSGPSDPVLEHSLTYALIDIGDASPIVPALDAVVPRVRAGALMAIEAIDAKRLQPELVARWLEEPDPGLRSRASFVALKHPEWGSEFVEAFEARLARAAGLSDEGKTELVSQLARFAGRPAIVSLLGQVLVRSGEPAARELTLKAIGRANLKHTPHEWIAPLVAILEGQEESTIQLAVSALRGQTDSRDDSIVQALRSTANRADFPLALRIESLSAIGASVGSLDTASFELLRDQIDLDRPVSIRSQAVDVLAKAQLDDSQRIALAACVRQAGPLELDRLLGAFSQGIPPGAEQTLLDSIGGAPGFTSLTPEILRERLAKIAPSRKPDVETLIQSLTRNQAQRHEKMEKLLSSLGEGDLRRGQAVFHGTKAACFSCHAIGYRGGNVGPDLTRIGAIRSERDLLEAIVEPSSSFVRSYEPWIVATGSGTIHTGLIKDEGADEVVLATSADEVVRIPRGDVEELRPGTVSLMPSGFDQQLTPQDLADLIAFLKAAK